MLANLVSKDDTALIFTNGTFSKRFADTARMYCNVKEETIESGKGFNIERAKTIIDSAMSNNNAGILGIVHNETSTGVENDIECICKYAKSKGMLVLVDEVSAWGGTKFDMNWGIDAFAVGSQKCIAAPPGLVLIGLSKDAIAKLEKTTPRTYYLDLKKYRKFGANNETPFTPAVSLFYGLDVALEIVEKEGLEKRIKRHAKAGRFVRKSIQEIGLELVAEKNFESNTVTAFKAAPEKLDVIKKGLLSKYNIEIAGGQGDLKGKILRVAHLGNFSMKDLKICMKGIKELYSA